MNKHKLQKTVIVIGATGLVGNILIEKLADHASYQRIACIVRKKPTAPITGVEYHELADFTKIADVVAQIKQPDQDIDAISCLGTTQKTAGSKSAFYDIDFGINYGFAQACQQHGIHSFYLLSSLGADEHSKTSFYLKTKGQLESAISELGFASYVVFRPSLLLGKHADRPFENISQSAFGLIQSIYPQHGKHRPIEAERVAQAIAMIADDPEHSAKKMTIISNTQMLKMTSNT